MYKLRSLILAVSLLLSACGKDPVTGQQSQHVHVQADEEVTVLAEAEMVIGPEGGKLALGETVLNVPPGTVMQEETFILQLLSGPPVPIDLPKGIKMYLETAEATLSYWGFSTSAKSFKNPVALQVAKSNWLAGSAGYILSPRTSQEESSHNNSSAKWSLVQLDLRGESSYSELLFNQPPITQKSGESEAGYYRIRDYEATSYIVSELPPGAIKRFCNQLDGSFNGAYCELPWKKREEPQIASDGVPYKVIAFNAGNLKDIDWSLVLGTPCDLYIYKMCTWQEEAIAREFLRETNPDIVAIQELWHDSCEGISDESRYRVCGKFELSSPQIERVVDPDIYDYACTAIKKLNGKPEDGYECVAVRKELFTILKNEKLKTSCGNGTDSDTGFQIVTLKLNDPVFPAFTTLEDHRESLNKFRVFNAHLASPRTDKDGSCRKEQIETLFGTPDEGGWRFGHAIALGDFNTDPLGNSNHDKALNGVVAPFSYRYTYSFDELLYPAAHPETPSYRGHFISDPRQGTVPVSANVLSFDHVISDFAGGKCGRVSVDSWDKFDHKATICTMWGFNYAGVQGEFTTRDGHPKAMWVNAGRDGVRGIGIDEFLLDGKITEIYVPDGMEADLAASYHPTQGGTWYKVEHVKSVKRIPAGNIQSWSAPAVEDGFSASPCDVTDPGKSTTDCSLGETIE